MQDTQKQHSTHHIPVLLEDTLALLDPKKGESYLDLTAGYGGHASKVLEKITSPENMVLVDQDHHAIDALERSPLSSARLIHSDFLSASQMLLEEEASFEMILLDIGVSSPQFDNAERGFSLKQDAPLDMRMDDRQQLTAAHIVNTYTKSQLAKMLLEFGEEYRAHKIAHAIVQNRPLKTTLELSSLVARTAGSKSKKWVKTHPATKTFQALRIATNQELQQLTDTLPLCLRLLKPGGRLAVISFHSLEDRIVKHFMKEHGGNDFEAELTLLTKKPILGNTNDVLNPRARSAMLRAAVKK